MGPRQNLIQMTLNYGFNILQTILFSALGGYYLSLTDSGVYSLIEAILMVLVITASITCSFTDPGIITIKSSVRHIDEEISVPEGAIYGHEFYTYIKKASILQELWVGKTTKGFSL